ncbi:hypothetical protein QVD17_20840 [Tagetes erecta]|uniref:SWIM-type domain-containing protein n=1 Tax=Tagetes erecta TaxID=13708 RepID=A0AAD8KMF1_TARER|nr:hypothetical protein QVD17_20840 [Tagetes erecta]
MIGGNEPSLFSLEIHHGGEFVKFPGRKYVRGAVAFIDMVDRDEFSVHDVDCMMQRLGYLRDEIIYYQFKIPGTDLDCGLRALGNDKDVISMLQYVHKFKIIEVYTEHKVTKLDTYFQSPDHGSKVFIEEIEDIGPSEPVRNSQQITNPCRRPLQLEWYVEDLNVEVNVEQPNIEVVVEEANQEVINEDLVRTPESDEELFKDNEGIQGNVNLDNPAVGGLFDNDDDFLAQFISEYGPDDREQQEANEEGSDEEGSGEEGSDGEGSDKEGSDEEGSDEEGSDEEGSDEDSDFVVDKDNILENVDVDMDEYRANVDMNVNEMPNEDDNIDIDDHAEIDLDNFDSASDDDKDAPIRKALRKLNKRAFAASPFYVGQTFGEKEEVRNIVTRVAIATRRQLVFTKSDKTKIRAVCQGKCPTVLSEGQFSQSSKPSQSCGSNQTQDSLKGKASNVVGGSAVNKKQKKRYPKPSCPWTLHISRNNTQAMFVVKTFKEEHRCLQTRKLRLYTVSAIAKELETLIESNPTIPVKSLQDLLQKNNQVQVSYQKVFRAKAMAIEKLEGDYNAQYGLLRDYCDELLRCNPGSTIKLDVEREPNPSSETRQFKRIYVCFGALKAGFKACGRQILGLDGCFMKGPFPGQILTVVGVDGNNGIYHVAYAVVEAETLSSWTWFLENLGDDLDLQADSNFTFISDRQKGILPALKKVFPAADHRYCLRHIHENMKTTKWRGHMFKDLLWKCASATTVPQFEHHMETIRKQDVGLYNWLKEIPPRHWSRSHFTGKAKCDILLNNLCEVFNKQLVGGRDKPIITCLEYIREYMMKRIIGVHKLISNSPGPLTPSATKAFEFIKSKAAEYNVLMAGVGKYQVSGPWLDQVCVDLDKRTCSCRKWEITCMPCKHAVACIWTLESPDQQEAVAETWVNKVYWLQTWKDVYSHTLEAINGRLMWRPSRCPTRLIAPKHHTQVGRPKKKRRSQQWNWMRKGWLKMVSWSRKDIMCNAACARIWDTTKDRAKVKDLHKQSTKVLHHKLSNLMIVVCLFGV